MGVLVLATERGSIDDLGSKIRHFRNNDLELVALICPRWNRLANWLREAERWGPATITVKAVRLLTAPHCGVRTKPLARRTLRVSLARSSG